MKKRSKLFSRFCYPTQVNLDMTDHCMTDFCIWRPGYDGRYAWSQSDAYQVFVICIRRILHMTDQFSWSHWVRHIQFHLYNSNTKRYYRILNFFVLIQEYFPFNIDIWYCTEWCRLGLCAVFVSIQAYLSFYWFLPLAFPEAKETINQ